MGPAIQSSGRSSLEGGLVRNPRSALSVCLSVTEIMFFRGSKMGFSPTGEATVSSEAFGDVVGKTGVSLMSKTNFVSRLGEVRESGMEV